MELSRLTAISPIDGRYHSKTKALQAYYSEYGLIRYRVLVEVEYFIALTAIPLPSLKDFPGNLTETLRDLYRNFSEDDALWIKETEKTTNHDVKAVEYFLKDKMRFNIFGRKLDENPRRFSFGRSNINIKTYSSSFG